MTKDNLVLLFIISFLIMRALAQEKYSSTSTAIAPIAPASVTIKCLTAVKIVEWNTSFILKFSFYSVIKQKIVWVDTIIIIITNVRSFEHCNFNKIRKLLQMIDL